MYTYIYILYIYICIHICICIKIIYINNFQGIHTHKYISHGWTFITKFHLEKSQPKKGNLSSSSTRRKGSAVVQAQFTPKSTCHGFVFAPRFCFLLSFPWIFLFGEAVRILHRLVAPLFFCKNLEYMDDPRTCFTNSNHQLVKIIQSWWNTPRFRVDQYSVKYCQCVLMCLNYGSLRV